MAAGKRLAGVLADVVFSTPAFPVWSNVTAAPIAGGQEHELATRQVVSPVRFAETLAGMAAAGVELFIHVGPGDVTAGMAKRSVPGAATLVVSDLGGIPPAIAALGSIP
jgi:[acyl-carrier-protein] S-malonyltransferase